MPVVAVVDKMQVNNNIILLDYLCVREDLMRFMYDNADKVYDCVKVTVLPIKGRVSHQVKPNL